MLNAVLMPKLSSTMTDGSVNEWFVEEGDYVKVGDPLFEVETDKIAIEVESYYEGYILKIYIGVNEEVPCNSTIAYIGEEGTEVPDTMDFSESIQDTVEKKADDLEQIVHEETLEEEVKGLHNRKVRATPYARKLSSQNNLDLTNVTGTGKDGRIRADDVKRYLSSPQTVTLQFEETTLIPWKGMRKAIADNMSYSYNTIPHISMNATVSITALKTVKNKLSEYSQQSITYTDLIAFMTVKALQKHPTLNATTSEDGITRHKSINLGIAVGLEEGLIVPVISQANNMSVNDLSTHIKELSAKAHNGSLKPTETNDGTFTISSLGRTRVKNFSSIINYPEVGILGIGGIYEQEDQEYVDLTLTFDHRALDGLPASQFLDYLIDLLESPELSIL